VFKQEVEELTAAVARCRLACLPGGHRAYSSTRHRTPSTSWSERAVGNASVTDSDPFARLPEPQGTPSAVSVYDPRLEGRGEDEKIDLALRVEKAALDYDPRVKLVEDTVYADAEAEVFLASSGGVRGSYRENDAYVFAYARRAGRQVETDSFRSAAPGAARREAAAAKGAARRRPARRASARR
jgi:PmbA protein